MGHRLAWEYIYMQANAHTRTTHVHVYVCRARVCVCYHYVWDSLLSVYAWILPWHQTNEEWTRSVVRHGGQWWEINEVSNQNDTSPNYKIWFTHDSSYGNCYHGNTVTDKVVTQTERLWKQGKLIYSSDEKTLNHGVVLRVVRLNVINFCVSNAGIEWQGIT